MLVALGTATAISATVGTVSMLAGGVVDGSDATEFWRTWWLGDTSGGLVVLPLMLAWARDPLAAWLRIRTWEGAAVILAVTALGVVAVSTEEPITYMVFPALIWVAFRFGAPGATLSIAITAAVAIGVTAHDVGPFSQQAINHKTLSTQLYIAVAALTTLFLSAVVSERERSSRDLALARRNEGERAVEERRRIARDLHDSVSQALFSTVLHTRAAQKAMEQDGASPSGRVAQSLSAIAELTKSVQSEMRALIFELRRDPVHDGLVSALSRHAASLRAADGPAIRGSGPDCAPCVIPGGGNPALRNRARGAGQCRQALPGHRCVRVGGDSERADPGGGPRQRKGVRPRRRTFRPLRPGLDAEPCSRGRGAAHDCEQARVRYGRARPGPRGDRWNLTRASAC